MGFARARNQTIFFYSDKNQVNSTLAFKFIKIFLYKRSFCVWVEFTKKSTQLNKEKTQPTNTLLAIKGIRSENVFFKCKIN